MSKDNIIEFKAANGNRTKDTVLDYLEDNRDSIVSITSIVEFDDGKVGIYADDKDIYTWLFQKKFLDYFVQKAFNERVDTYLED